MICGIYKITNTVNDKFYIGSSKDIEKRWRYHKADFKANRHCNQYFQNAWNKHGEENFKFEVLEIVEDLNDLYKIEQDWLDKLHPYGNSGYNISKITNSYSALYKLSSNTIFKLQNRKFTKEHKRNMRLNSPNKKEVIQLSEQGEYIKTWDSVSEASRNLKISVDNISACCRFEESRLSAGGYLWIYLEDYNNKDALKNIKINVEKIHKSNQISKREVIQLSTDGKIIAKWKNIVDASSNTTIANSSISSCCQGKQDTAMGFRWMFLEDFLNNNTENLFVSKERKKKKVVQMDMKYNVLKTWDSIYEVVEIYGFEEPAIRRCCINKTLSSNGFRWLYEDIYNSGNYTKSITNGQAKPVLQISMDDNTIIKEWDRLKDIEVLSGFKASSIKSVCSGATKTNIHKGFRWVYKQDYLRNNKIIQKQGRRLYENNDN